MGGRSAKIHIRIQFRNGRKCITTIQGLDDGELDLKKIMKAMKKEFNTNGSLESSNASSAGGGTGEDDVIQLQGDQRHSSKEWLVRNEVLSDREAEERIVIHGA